MNRRFASLLVPKHIWVLLALYGVTSAVHFAHNAELIAFYPSMPAWLTRERVYLAWLSVTAVGLTGVFLAAVGRRNTRSMVRSHCTS